jgi:hypothetical protein
MKGEPHNCNKILTVKSLIENSKQQKKHYLQFVMNDLQNTSLESMNVPKNPHHNYPHQRQIPHSHR